MQTEDDSNYVEDQSVRQGAKETDQDAAYQHGTDLVVIAHRNAFHIDVFAALSGHRCGGDHAEHGHHDGDSGGGKDGNCDGQFPFQEAEYGAIGDKPGPKAGGFSHAKAGNDRNEGNAKHEDRPDERHQNTIHEPGRGSVQFFPFDHRVGADRIFAFDRSGHFFFG